LQGLANRYAGSEAASADILLPGTGGTRGGGQPRPAPPIGVTVTMANGQKAEGTLNRLDDFMVSLKMADGHLSHAPHRRPEPAEGRVARSAQGSSRSAQMYSDADIHNITAYLVTLK
jgi:hypothetical protein